MKVNAILLAASALLCGLVLGCSNGADATAAGQGAKNIILFIGDGMGAEHRKAARWMSAGESGRLSMEEMPARGQVRTVSADNAITDSAAGATAMATGIKTNNGVLGLDAGLRHVPTILEEAKLLGKSVGLVTTTHVTHATPAAFTTHIASRELGLEIAAQILATGPDIILGGGEDEFLPKEKTGCYPEAGERDDGRHLIDEAKAAGYAYVCDAAAFASVDPAVTSKLIGLFSDEGMLRPYSPSLAEMTRKTIDILSQNNNGFFLLVEAGQIDWASHEKDAAHAIADTIGLDDAVDIARRFAAHAGDTLIIVTADHETGGMSTAFQPTGQAGEDGPFATPDGKKFYINWSAFGHTAANVPVTSQGPLSDRLTGIKDNTQIYDVMRSAFSLGNDRWDAPPEQ